MNLRALTLVGLVALSLSAVACSASSTEPVVTSPDNEVRSRPTSNLSTDELEAELAKAVDGLEYMSEADYPFTVLVAAGEPGALVDAEAIKAAFNGQVGDGTNESMALKDMPGSSIHEFDNWMVVGEDEVDDSDPDSVKYANGIKRAHDLMKANLTDLKVILMAESSLESSEDVGFLHAFIVGRAKDGSLVALHTGVVWT